MTGARPAASARGGSAFGNGGLGSAEEVVDFLETVLEASTENSIIGTDLEGRIVLANAQTERLFGFTREELVGHPIETLIPERYRDRRPEHRTGFLHEPRQVASSATRRTHEGTGLGLYISQRLAQLIRNEIDFESEPGKGSTFVLELRGRGQR